MRARLVAIALAVVLISAVPAAAIVEPPLRNTTYFYLSKDRKVNAFMTTTASGRQAVGALYCGSTGTFLAETPRFTIQPDGRFDGQVKVGDSRFRLLGKVDGRRVAARLVAHGYPLCGEFSEGVNLTVGHSKPAYFQPLRLTARRQGVIQVNCFALVKPGEVVPINGDLLPAVNASKVDLTAIDSNGASGKTTVNTVNSHFNSGFKVNPSAALGTGTVVASFKGDATRRGTSKTCQFEVTNGPQTP